MNAATKTAPALTIVCFRRKHYIAAGKVRLSRGYASAELAAAELERGRSFYAYWAGSASVSADNTDPVIVRAD